MVPLPDRVGAVEGALIEPWTCVAAAYQIAARTHLRSGGTLRFCGFADQPSLDFNGLRFGGVPERLGVPPPPPERDAQPPRQVTASGLHRANRVAVRAWCAHLGIPLRWQEDEPLPCGADDVVIVGAAPGARWMAQLFAELPYHAVVSVQSGRSDAGARLACDIGRIHYRGIRLVGREDGQLARAYAGATRTGLLAGGRAWFVGGGGPMGQMHVLLALAQRRPSAEVVVTDLSAVRLAALGERVAALGLRPPRLLQVGAQGQPSAGELRRLVGDGFDDIVLLAPTAAAAEQVAPALRAGGYLNVFAGVPEGGMARIPLRLITRGAVRMAGTTGSPLAATEHTLARVVEGTLRPATVLGALADLRHGGAALQAVASGRIAGKVVVLPAARGLGLKTLDELAATGPDWRAALGRDRQWSPAAETLCRTWFCHAGPDGSPGRVAGAAPSGGAESSGAGVRLGCFGERGGGRVLRFGRRAAAGCGAGASFVARGRVRVDAEGDPYRQAAATVPAVGRKCGQLAAQQIDYPRGRGDRQYAGPFGGAHAQQE